MIPVTKPIRRKVTTARGAPLIIEVTADGVIYREPRRRQRYTLPHGVAFIAAVRLHVAAQKAEKRERAKLRKAAR